MHRRPPNQITRQVLSRSTWSKVYCYNGQLWHVRAQAACTKKHKEKHAGMLRTHTEN